MRLLVVEDEEDLNEIIVKELRSQGYLVDTCFDGNTALDYFSLEKYDGAILDVMLPYLDGFQVLQEIRKKGNQTPVLFLTARNDKADIVRGLDIGADDYILKPFDFDELLARIRVMVRRKVEVGENSYRCGNLVVNVNDHSIKRGEKEILLSPKEYALLLCLIRNKNTVMTRQQIENNLWEFDYGRYSNVVDVYIRYLRKKIDDGFEHKMIQTIRGVGYMLRGENE